jgi:hypothetical protein
VPQDQVEIMKRQTFKVAAVVSSLVLVGGYVALQSGHSSMPGTKSGRVNGPADETSRSAKQPARRALLPGSKSNRMDEEGQNVLYGDGKVEFEEKPFTKSVLPGSKVYILRTPPSTQPSGDTR